jgi:hypothetical protein
MRRLYGSSPLHLVAHLALLPLCAAALSLLMLVVFFGTIGERGEGAYHAVSGLDYDGYALRWLLVSAGLFAASALVYGLRRGSRT